MITVGDKQFISIETRDGKIFYLIIDAGQESDNVYLATEATTQDLQSFTEDEASETTGGDRSEEGSTPDSDVDTATLIDAGTLKPEKESSDKDSLIDSSNSSENSDTQKDSSDRENEKDTDGDAAEKTDKKKGNPIPGWLVIIVMVFILSFAGYLFLIVLPRKKAKEVYINGDDDDEILEEDYPDELEVFEEEEVNEPELDMSEETEAQEENKGETFENPWDDEETE